MSLLGNIMHSYIKFNSGSKLIDTCFKTTLHIQFRLIPLKFFCTLKSMDKMNIMTGQNVKKQKPQGVKEAKSGAFLTSTLDRGKQFVPCFSNLHLSESTLGTLQTADWVCLLVWELRAEFPVSIFYSVC